MKRTTIFLPDELHERLRQEAFQKRVSMAELIRSRLDYSPEAGPRRAAKQDPLPKKASGAGPEKKRSKGIVEALYGF